MIDALGEQLDENLHNELLNIYKTLLVNPVGAILQLSRAGLLFMELLFASVGASRPSDNLWDCIVRAGKGDEGKKIKGLGILPDEIASLLHTIRTYANKADHATEKIHLTVEDAEICLRLFLRVLKWFYFEYNGESKNPRARSESGF